MPLHPAIMVFGNLQGQHHGEKLFFNAHWAGHPSASKATVAIRILAQVLLVVVFSIVELLSLSDISGDGAKAMLCKNLWRERERPQDLVLDTGLLRMREHDRQGDTWLRSCSGSTFPW